MADRARAACGGLWSRDTRAGKIHSGPLRESDREALIQLLTAGGELEWTLWPSKSSNPKAPAFNLEIAEKWIPDGEKQAAAQPEQPAAALKQDDDDLPF
jgi:hypothetical protein